ncbi:harmonin-binding protein USHBP1 isoform X2 [Microcaecilia unicolor]|uniref:Colorectal mutant cancer protein-like isoform X2 n=1 Tax=Microcaecilia unicolor TaxID=1415580 RepID=A0A6P7Z216_9AMPH|nr:colorectal mutant cancer protein-like isoform X2 [Microcaecilia unicolor]
MDILEPNTVEPDALISGTGESDLEAADGLVILRYEEYITKLLVTIADLNSKIECLQQHMGSREDDDYTDQCSQYTASLPRCVWKPPSYSDFETSPFPEPYAGEDESSDLFLELQKVVASLERMVYSRRNLTTSPINSNTATGDGDPSLAREEWALTIKVLEEIEQGLGITPVEEEISSFRDRNMALRVVIGDKELELDRSKVTMKAFQEERDKLQRKVHELQTCVQKMEAPLFPATRCSEFLSTGGANSPACEEELWAIQDAFRNPIILAKNLVHCLQTILGAQHLCQLLSLQHQPVASHGSIKNLETETQQLRGYLDKLWILNDLLAVTLEECKSHSEKLSMLLGKQESKSTMLRLALQCSERCMEVYAALLAQADWKQDLLQQQVLRKSLSCPGGDQRCPRAPQDLDSAVKLMILEAKKVLDKRDPKEGEKSDSEAGFPCSWSPVVLSSEDEVLLKDYVQKLKKDRASVIITLASLREDGVCLCTQVAHLNDVIRAKVDDAIEAALDILPGIAEKPQLDRIKLQQDLTSTREEISDLKTQLHITEKEKRVLELQTLAHGAQEAAYLLLTEHLQWELEEWTGKRTMSMSSESSTGDSCSMGDDSEGETPVTRAEGDPSVIQELMQSFARSSELRDRIQVLLTALEKSMKDSNSQKLQSVQITTDIFRTHSDLIFAYKNSKKKYKDQLEKLQTQMASMSEQHKEEIHCLKQNIQRLEECQKAKISGETLI